MSKLNFQLRKALGQTSDSSTKHLRRMNLMELKIRIGEVSSLLILDVLGYLIERLSITIEDLIRLCFAQSMVGALMPFPDCLSVAFLLFSIEESEFFLWT